MIMTNRFCFKHIHNAYFYYLLKESCCLSAKLILSILLLSVLCSCTWLQGLSTPKPQVIDLLLEQKNYNNVLAVVDAQLARSLDEPQKDYWLSVRERVTTESAIFQQEQVQRLTRLARRNEWQTANIEQDFLQQHLPSNEVLDNVFSEVNLQRQQYIDGLTLSLAKLEAQHLPKTLEFYERLYKANAEDVVALRRWQQEKEKRERLMVTVKMYAAIAEAEQQYAVALEHLRSIQRLEDSPEILSQIKRLRSLLLEQQKQKIARSNSSALSKSQQQQLLDYDAAMNQQQWLEAKTILTKMLKQRPGDKALLDEQQQLTESIGLEIERATALGEAYYSEGNIEYALTAWQAALPLDANNSHLLTNIERAQRILDKVKALKEGGANDIR